ncbi:Homoprotocatechuate degradative operon repressor, partial [Durusdinium trenchii]
ATPRDSSPAPIFSDAIAVDNVTGTTRSGEGVTLRSFRSGDKLTGSRGEMLMTKSRLQTELKKRQPFESAEQEAVLNVLKTGDEFENRLGRLFRQYGLTPSQYNVLRILRGEGRPLPSLEIANRTIQVVPAITGLIDRLEKQGLVARRRCTDDRRVVYVEITPTGLELIAQIDAPLETLHQQLVGHLSEQEQQTLSRLLEKARSGAGSDSDS